VTVQPEPHRRSSDRPRGTFISPTGTWFQGALVVGIVMSSIAATTALVKSVSKAEALEAALSDQQESTKTLAVAANDLTRSLVVLQGDIKNLSEKVGGIQNNTAQSSRDAQVQALTLAKIESDLESIKGRMTAAEGTMKTIESRLITVEIAASRSGNPHPATGGDGK
jgi:chromosome segregation ATPase